MKKIAVHINTDQWNQIIDTLKRKGWFVTYKYFGFDAGIDYDRIIVRRGFKKITFQWTNWMEGEIVCSDELFDYLESEFNMTFTFENNTINRKPPNLFKRILLRIKK
ncbi:MAG: hypothetical protein K0U54_04060 [Bacteroidetes bacterium]|nr:hypothetical protein [Bacteroidota bacterium]